MPVHYSLRYKDAANPNGYPYFFDPKTGATSWDIPLSLILRATSRRKSGEFPQQSSESS